MIGASGSGAKVLPVVKFMSAESEIKELEKKLDVFQHEIRIDMAGIRDDLKEVIRLDGDLKRHNDAISRIGKQVDAHETRLLSLEKTGAVTDHSSNRSAGFIDNAMLVVLGAVASYVITKALSL